MIRNYFLQILQCVSRNVPAGLSSWMNVTQVRCQKALHDYSLYHFPVLTTAPKRTELKELSGVNYGCNKVQSSSLCPKSQGLMASSV